ncbi:unnamed protein product [Vitrella brassicaformis CCMP3155]|uniref:DUF6314 domain-containing protein n=1 Tax=Vitrella brassicaformis (strain CCMP3155) TaxID=1169540 RepID=A0A0G4EXL3_VITBC|nr:unnamed protein product [Vitrella brassicaformis CCMP3155]|eukprot:CEM03988.1 unnamed protein product [Vitrella brassicaformis CCMP3155]
MPSPSKIMQVRCSSVVQGSTMQPRASVESPTSPAANMYDYLKGEWRTSKAIDYRLGGGRGTMDGTVHFRPITSLLDGWHGDGDNAHTPLPILLYTEEGTLTLEDSGGSFAAYRRYVYDCRKQIKTDVYFVDSDYDLAKLLAAVGKGDEGAVCGCLRHFHSIERGDGGDEGQGGQMRFVSDDEFECLWTVRGPSKDGHIRQVFRRVRAGGDSEG